MGETGPLSRCLLFASLFLAVHVRETRGNAFQIQISLSHEGFKVQGAPPIPVSVPAYDGSVRVSDLIESLLRNPNSKPLVFHDFLSYRAAIVVAGDAICMPTQAVGSEPGMCAMPPGPARSQVSVATWTPSSHKAIAAFSAAIEAELRPSGENEPLPKFYQKYHEDASGRGLLCGAADCKARVFTPQKSQERPLLLLAMGPRSYDKINNLRGVVEQIVTREGLKDAPKMGFKAIDSLHMLEATDSWPALLRACKSEFSLGCLGAFDAAREALQASKAFYLAHLVSLGVNIVYVDGAGDDQYGDFNTVPGPDRGWLNTLAQAQAGYLDSSFSAESVDLSGYDILPMFVYESHSTELRRGAMAGIRSADPDMAANRWRTAIRETQHIYGFLSVHAPKDAVYVVRDRPVDPPSPPPLPACKENIFSRFDCSGVGFVGFQHWARLDLKESDRGDDVLVAAAIRGSDKHWIPLDCAVGGYWGKCVTKDRCAPKAHWDSTSAPPIDMGGEIQCSPSTVCCEAGRFRILETVKTYDAVTSLKTKLQSELPFVPPPLIDKRNTARAHPEAIKSGLKTNGPSRAPTHTQNPTASPVLILTTQRSIERTMATEVKPTKTPATLPSKTTTVVSETFAPSATVASRPSPVTVVVNVQAAQAPGVHEDDISDEDIAESIAQAVRAAVHQAKNDFKTDTSTPNQRCCCPCDCALSSCCCGCNVGTPAMPACQGAMQGSCVAMPCGQRPRPLQHIRTVPLWG